jgi:PAS domain S-box-containing protein
MLNAESDTEQSRDDIFKTVSSGGIWRGEILNRRKNGSTFPIEATVFPLVDDQGNIFAYASNQRDITVRKLAEQTAARFSSVLEKSLNEIYIFDEETLHFIQVNYGARANLGYSMEELQDLTPLDLKPEFTAAKFAKLIQPLRDGTLEKLEFITVHRRKDGSQYHVEVHLQLMTEGSPVFVAIIRDITERRQAEEALRQSQERFDLAVKGSTDGLWSWSISSGQPRWFSPRAFEMLGYEDGEIPGTHEAWIQLIHPDDRNATMEAVQANIENDVAYDVELRLRTKLGDYRWFRSRGITFRDENGNPVRMAGSIQDIEDRKQAEEELARYRLHLEEMVQMRTEELTEAQETLRKVYRRLLNAGESERKILASNLHDSTGQKLFAMALAVQQTILACQDTPGHEDQIQALRNVSQQCTETIQEIRTICYGLYPPMLELTGLATSLEQLGRSCQPAASFQLECDKALAKARFDPEQEIALFRIAQEAVSNAMRHGHAKNITMSLNQHDGELAMAVSDDGVGFDTASQLGKGLGLRSMTERALAVGGTLAITSQPGRTSIEASLPAKPIDTQAT